MKLYIKKDSAFIEVEQVKSLDSEGEIIILHGNVVLRRTDTEELEAYLSEKIGKKVIFLDAKFSNTIHSL